MAATAWAEEPVAADFAKDVLPVMQKYCWDCHGDGADTFVFTGADSFLAVGGPFRGPDRITDFNVIVDRIDAVNGIAASVPGTLVIVSAPSAITTIDQALTAANLILVGSDVRIVVFTVGADTVVFFEDQSQEPQGGVGNTADQIIILTGNLTLTADNFI